MQASGIRTQPFSGTTKPVRYLRLVVPIGPAFDASSKRPETNICLHRGRKHSPSVTSSGIRAARHPARLLDRVRDGTITLISSPVLLAELAEVLEQPKFDVVLARSNTSRERSLAEIQALAEVLVPEPLPQPICRDPDDDHVLALALTAQVDLIVSGDKDLLDLNSFESIPIVTPADALRTIETQK